jgi:hypothetical protein
VRETRFCPPPPLPIPYAKSYKTRSQHRHIKYRTSLRTHSTH